VLVAGWTADVIGAAQPDRRSRFLRTYWERRGREAGLAPAPVAPGPT
jgi:hypothetical protein